MKRLAKFLMLGWTLWALDLDDITVVKAERIYVADTESWSQCTYTSLLLTRGELNHPSLTLRPGRKQPTAIFQCLPESFTPKTGNLREGASFDRRIHGR
jgi:hypothetical protein